MDVNTGTAAIRSASEAVDIATIGLAGSAVLAFAGSTFARLPGNK
jgi:hypothetical protein